MVKHPNKPNKWRIVWDAAAEVKGTSLNSLLLKGPDELCSLMDILYRFREHPVAISGDLQEMFHQIYTAPQDQNAQRFLWRDGNQQREPDTYAMRVMTFGAKCSPAIAEYIKNHNADRFKSQYPKAVEAIKTNHYVDDWLQSFSSSQEAKLIASQVSHIHRSGGFFMRSWKSNDSNLLKSLSNAPENTKCFGTKQNTPAIYDKVLGLNWDNKGDTLLFILNRSKVEDRIINGSCSPTKRQVLRLVMSIFDPLGLVSYFIIRGKILLQDIWREGIQWDEQINTLQFEKWMAWLNMLLMMEHVKFQRHYFSNANITHVEAHIFVDASEDAYAAIIYFRYKHNSKIYTTLVTSKTKVAPQKPHTIPRLELMGALLGSRLMNTVSNAHTLQITQRTFWCDSKTVIQWLRSDHRRFKQFVAFRLSEILETTKVNEWRWIPSKLNIADYGTKPPKELNDAFHCLWQSGPKFLSQDESHWPTEMDHKNATQNQEELRLHIMHSTKSKDASEPPVPPIPDIPQPQNFSSWNRLLRSQVMVRRAAHNFLRTIRNTHKQRCTVPITVDEITQAEIDIFRQVQAEAYLNELKSMQNHNQVDRDSSIYRLCPFIDNHGVIRMNTRITTYQPIILPTYHHVTSLIIHKYHRKFLHANNETTINEIRQKFSVYRLRAALKKVISSCNTCKILKAKPIPPQMGILPTARMSPFTRPFSYTGVDYFGPMEVVVGRRIEKRWGVLFTCMSIRAIHLEIAHSLTTASCILSLRNFISIRGCPLEMFSDNGTNFRGANAELLREIAKLNMSEIQETFNTFKWTFIPPSSPHMGGCWERLIRSVKSNLLAVIPQRRPTDEVLRSGMLEVMNIVNSRPLTHIPLDSEDQEALTPNHFLLGSSSGTKPPIPFSGDETNLRNTWKTAQLMADSFWRKWVREYLPTIARRTKWFYPTKPLEEGDVVVIADENSPRIS